MTLLDQWKIWWAETANERPEYQGDKSSWRVASPRRNPEDEDWWFTNGYKFFDRWVQWRDDNPHMVIATFSDGEPAIEIEASPMVEGVQVKMFIDRVFYDTEKSEYCIVDLKTGKTTPDSALQLAFYSYGLRKVYGLEVTKGYYWMARKGELSPSFDLADYTDSKIEALVTMFDRARKDNIFVPNFQHCKMCGLTEHCDWYTQPKENDE